MFTLMGYAKHFTPFALLALFISLANAQKAPIQITADLTDAPRKLFHADMDFPVSVGPITLISPQWIPGWTKSIRGPMLRDWSKAATSWFTETSLRNQSG